MIVYIFTHIIHIYIHTHIYPYTYIHTYIDTPTLTYRHTHSSTNLPLFHVTIYMEIVTPQSIESSSVHIYLFNFEDIIHSLLKYIK